MSLLQDKESFQLTSTEVYLILQDLSVLAKTKMPKLVWLNVLKNIEELEEQMKSLPSYDDGATEYTVQGRRIPESALPEYAKAIEYKGLGVLIKWDE